MLIPEYICLQGEPLNYYVKFKSLRSISKTKFKKPVNYEIRHHNFS